MNVKYIKRMYSTNALPVLLLNRSVLHSLVRGPPASELTVINEESWAQLQV